MSKNNNLKDKIKKSSPATQFFNTYIDDNDNINNNDVNNNNVNIDNINSNNNNESINNNINENDNDSKSIKNDINIKISKEDNDIDIIDKIVNVNNKNKKNLSGIYFEPSVEKILNKLAQKGGRGAKSKIVNELVKEGFIKRGLMK